MSVWSERRLEPLGSERRFDDVGSERRFDHVGSERRFDDVGSERRLVPVISGPPAVTRRDALGFMGAALLASGLFPWPAARAAENDALAFGSGSLEGALRALGAALDSSTEIQLAVPDFVENGSVVPVEVTSELPGSQTIFVFSEANPFPLVARFWVPEGTDPYVSTRIKVAQSCNIYALVEASGRFYSTVKSTTVTVGGCGNG